MTLPLTEVTSFETATLSLAVVLIVIEFSSFAPFNGLTIVTFGAVVSKDSVGV